MATPSVSIHLNPDAVKHPLSAVMVPRPGPHSPRHAAMPLCHDPRIPYAAGRSRIARLPPPSSGAKGPVACSVAHVPRHPPDPWSPPGRATPKASRRAIVGHRGSTPTRQSSLVGSVAARSCACGGRRRAPLMRLGWPELASIHRGRSSAMGAASPARRSVARQGRCAAASPQTR